MKSDQDTRAAGWVGVELLEEEAQAFHGSLGEVLERIAPLTAPAKSLSGEEHLRRLAAAINVVLDTLEDLTGMADLQQLAHLIERVGQLAVTGDNVQVHIGIAGDLRVDKHHRLGIEAVLASLRCVPPSVRAAAVREGMTTLQRLLALLLFHGWTDHMSGSAARQAAQRAIIDTVQGRVAAAPVGG